jgi:[protein-PII] uridylyltransferase
MSPDQEAAFVQSMPEDYRASFDRDAYRAHGEIVQRRGARTVHVEIWREESERVVAICVVADDKPGLLSRISAALVATQIDVVSAHAYVRTRADGTAEAVDFLWIRRLPRNGAIAPIRARDVVAVAKAIEGAIALPHDAAIDSEPLPPVRGGGSARIRFENDMKNGVTVLTVEAVDRPGLLLAVTQALFRAGIQIVGLRATTERGSAIDRFQLAEADSKPLRGDRLLELQSAILAALDDGGLRSAS